MNRPKKEFIPTSLSDLNIDTLSIGSNSDRHNNNGGRLNNFDRFKATSSSNLSFKHSNVNSSNKTYGSQSNLSIASSSAGRNGNFFNHAFNTQQFCSYKTKSFQYLFWTFLGSFEMVLLIHLYVETIDGYILEQNCRVWNELF